MAFVAGVLGVAVLFAALAEARSHPEGRTGVPAMVRRALPAVVSITTRQIEHDQFNRPVTSRGLGSGIIVDRRGYILTNAHVVDGAEQIKVTLTDGRAFRATLVGKDGFTDLAVIRIEAGNLPALRLGDSRRLAVGETVIAIGSPLWLEGGPTVTVGVVSALGRSMEDPGLPVLHGMIQTDAAINAGNSGGPLLNLAGEVVGINTAMIASAHGIGFAVSSTMAKPVVAALIATGRVIRPTIRLEAVTLTPQVAYANDFPIESGALVVRVDPDGAAEAAGLEAGDVITAVAGRAVRDLHQLHDQLARQRIGEEIPLSVWRAGTTLTLRPRLEEYR